MRETRGTALDTEKRIGLSQGRYFLKRSSFICSLTELENMFRTEENIWKRKEKISGRLQCCLAVFQIQLN